MLCRLSFEALSLVAVFSTVTLVFGQEVQPIQWASVPFDPNEPVTGSAKILTNPQERSAALQLLDRARQNYNFYGPHAPAFTMKVTFTSSGQSQYEGSGSMQETWTGSAVRWSAKIGSAETLRILHGGQAWSDNPSAAVPMRVQMARAALLWPVVNPPTRVTLRSAAANIQGRTATCVLTSGQMPAVEQPRHWVEKEYCIDSENGNLLVWSEAPGHFVFYDYTNPLEFRGHVVANEISIYEAGNRVMQIRVQSIEDASGVNPDSLRPTPQQMAAGPSFTLGSPMKFPLPVPAAQGISATTLQPVFIHATIDRQGNVVEAEALETSNPELAARAIEALRRRNQGSSNVQREVFVNVQLHVETPLPAGAQ
jgi:hypothetical protein